MSYGFQFENPGGTLVMSTEAKNYCYLGTPTLYTASSKDTNSLYPYIYRITMPNSTAVPVVACRVTSSTVVDLLSLERGSGNDWYIWVNSVNYIGCQEPDTITPTAPTLYVFSSGIAASGQSFGAQLFTSDGSLSLDLGNTPLWVKEVVNFYEYQGSYTGYLGAWAGDGSRFNVDDRPMTVSYTTPAVIGCAGGGYGEIQYSTGEPLDSGGYGWSLNGSNLRRARYWQLDSRPYAPFNPSWDSVDYYISPTKALLIDAATL